MNIKTNECLTSTLIDDIVLEMKVIVRGYPDVFVDDLDSLQHKINTALQEQINAKL